MRQDWSAGQFLQPREITGVIEMAVSEEDRLDVEPGQTDAVQDLLETGQFADQPRVNQHRLPSRAIIKEMKRPGVATDGINPARIFHLNIV